MAGQDQKDTVTCTINGREITVPKGHTIIEAAERAGIGIPHYCYHPGLSAPAMCRMCLVDVEGAPKLQPACITPAGDGQVIDTESSRAREAREGVLEFYLFNHPLDCPICDQSGECKLQDFVFQEGRKKGRSLEAKRVFGRDDFGGDVLYYGDRCIMCTRCVRFMREIAGEDLLCVVQRGHRSVIDTFFDQGVGSSAWSGNIVDICPVGALVSKDFLHKARVWDLDRAPSICPNCTQGCNILIDTRDNLVMRLKPRPNHDVNSYWMCDYGRHRYEWMNRGATEVGGGMMGQPSTTPERGLGVVDVPTGRLEAPLVRGADGEHRATSWQEAINQLVDRLKRLRAESPGAFAIASPFHANEDAGMLLRLAHVLGGGRAAFRSVRTAGEEVCAGFPRLARRRDLAANVRGLEVMGWTRAGSDAGTGGLEPPAGGVLLVLGDELADQPEDFGRAADLFVYLGCFLSPAARNADFILPVTTFAEQEGTFTNHEGRVQRFWPALQPPSMARPGWQVLGVILAGLDDAPAPASAADAFLRLGELHDDFSGLGYEMLGTRGAILNEPVKLTGGQTGGTA